VLSPDGTSAPSTPDPFQYAADVFDPPDEAARRQLLEEQRARAATLAGAWRRQARPEQIPPTGEWRVWYVRGGRGGGKTWTGGNALAEWIRSDPEPGAWAVVAPTYGDARDTCIEGESGLLAALDLPRVYAGWNRSMGELRLPDGTVVFVDGADDGALRIQGKNLKGAWCDEVGLWRRWQTAWDESIAYAVRKGDSRIIATGTPKANLPARALVKRLLDDPDVPVSTLRTLDNVAHLSEKMLTEARAKLGTRLGRQELEGELLEDLDGALWRPQLIEELRVFHAPELVRVVVGVDPAATSNDTSDETGIVVAGLGRDGHGYVLADRSGRYTPDRWGKEVVAAYMRHHGDRVVPEVNNGGEMVTHVIRTVDPTVPVKPVHASRGKVIRAEPVAALYEQGRVHHVGQLPELEDQITSWTPGDRSPDRMDALVWALTELMLNKPRGFAAVA
jgi:phage terminase large subunit-like protein